MTAVLFLCAALCLLVGIILLVTSQSSAPPHSSNPYIGVGGVVPVSTSPVVPELWNEPAITRQLTQLRDDRPALIPHFVQSITERFILRQDDRTAQLRLRFLRSQIDQLKLAKEFQAAMDDLELHSSEKSLRLKKLQLEIQKVDIQFESADAVRQKQQELESKKLDLEIAKLDQQIDSIKNPPRPLPAEPQLTPEQRKAKEKKDCEDRIATLKAERQKALKLPDEHERIIRVNALDDAIQREYERWAKLV